MRYVVICIVAGISTWCFALDTNSINEHVYGGLPSTNDVQTRTAYVIAYDSAHKAPAWVAYHLTKDYRQTPKRSGKWADYRNDPTRTDEPKDSDYTGTYGDIVRNYAKGHLAPFFICGGDRDDDGMVLDADGDGKVEEGDDEDEATTVYEVNYHSNLTPQHHNSFNGSGGVWNYIETRIRKIIDEGEHDELWVFAGPIFGLGEYDVIGNDVHVAPMFFQIIIWEDDPDAPRWEAYMMPHHQKNHGSIEEHRVSIRHIEAMTGLDFFPDLDLGDLERTSTYP